MIQPNTAALPNEDEIFDKGNSGSCIFMNPAFISGKLAENLGQSPQEKQLKAYYDEVKYPKLF